MRWLDLVLPITLGVAFVPALASLAAVWSATEYQSHGFLVLGVAAWIAFATRARWLPGSRERDGRGAALVVASLVVYLLGLLTASASLLGVALVAAVAGTVWFLGGTRWLSALAFPIGFLVFVIPIPPDWITPLVVQLLLFVSTASVAIVQAFGIPILREGNVLTLGSGESLFVAEACSGLTSLVTLTPIGVLIAYLAPLTTARRLLLVALVLPIALVANLVRVLATVLGGHVLGVATVTEEPQHSLLGLSVYLIGCGGLLMAARWLRSDAAPLPTSVRRSPTAS
jgi:exosortase